MIHTRTARLLLPALALGASFQAGASVPAAIGETAISEKIDSIDQVTDKLDGLVRRSILNGGSKPVSFAGEADAKLVASSFFVAPQWMLADKTEFKNSSVTLRMAMVAKPHRNLTLWSKLAFTNALLGYPTQRRAEAGGLDSTLVTGDDAWQVAPSAGDANDKRGAVLYEDMSAGMIMSFGPTSFHFKAGGVLWNEMSPLTVWKTQPRMFGWDYLPYELEQSTAMFYDYATVKGFKEGRAAWNKKPFQGLQFESIELPWNLYFNTVYGFYEGYNKNAPWLVPSDKTNELQYTDPATGAARTGASKSLGIGDNYRAIWLVRMAKAEIPGGVTAGANWFQYLIDEDYPLQWAKNYGYSLTGPADGLVPASSVPVTTGSFRVAGGDSGVVLDRNLAGRRYNNNFYLEPRVGTIDFRRNLPGGFNFHVDIGASNVDSVFYKVGARTAGSGTRLKRYTSDELATPRTVRDSAIATRRADTAVYLSELAKYDPRFQSAAASAIPWSEIGRASTGWKPAVYTSLSYAFPTSFGDIETELRSMYADKDFHSGASTVGPINGIFPYESNLTGPGKFGGVDNGTSYSSNLAGTNLIVKLPVPRGHARISSGFHTQVKEGDDLVYFPWRQNGAAFVASMNSDFTRYGVGLLDDFWRSTKEAASTPAEYRMIRRLGDESFFRATVRNPYAPIPGYAGGMRADYMAVYEGFAPYKLSKSFRKSVRDGADLDSGLLKSDSLVLQQIIANQDSGLFRMQHKKATQNLSLDVSYEVSQIWKGSRSVFLSGYAAFNSITEGSGMGIPAFATGDKVLLVGRNLRFEPVFQLTPKFYIIGLITQEVWKSDFGVAMIDSATGLAPKTDAAWLVSGTGIDNIQRAPIDYTDWMYGLGFDWDIAPRVSLHVRGQYFTHEDAGISVDVPTAAGRNDYRAWLGTTEMKMWF